MSRRRDERLWAEAALWGALAVALSLAMLFIRAWAVSRNDYGIEAAPALSALLAGHLARFLALAPSYGPSLALRAPFALLGTLAGGGTLAVFRASALPCVLALAALGTWLALAVRRAGRGRGSALLVVLAATANPLTYFALVYGHPEELLGAVLCAAAVLAAVRERAGWAGILLGLAIANKQWGLLAAGPVLLALPSGRVRAMLLAGAVAALALGPFFIAAAHGSSGAARLVPTSTGWIFTPWQLWWFLGTPGHWSAAMAPYIMRGYRWPPNWLPNTHLLIVVCGALLTLLAARARMNAQRALLALVLLFVIRCALDPWDVVYYPLPGIVALLAWEVTCARRAPWLALATSGLCAVLFKVIPGALSADAAGAAFGAGALLSIALLAARVLRRADDQSTTSSSFGVRFRFLTPSASTITRSSIRTPSSPGR